MIENAKELRKSDIIVLKKYSDPNYASMLHGSPHSTVKT